jgi:hypothetical protein
MAPEPSSLDHGAFGQLSPSTVHAPTFTPVLSIMAVLTLIAIQPSFFHICDISYFNFISIFPVFCSFMVNDDDPDAAG